VDKHWFVFYTKSRQEKKVRDLLVRSGKEVFLPMQKVMRQWSDRKKKVEAPLFNSYIFVKESEHNLVEVLQTPGVAWTIRHNGKPAVLHDKEYDVIQRFIETGFFLESAGLDPETFRSGDKVKVTDGPLRGLVGVLTGDANKRKFTVALEGIDQVIKTDVPSNILEKV
jgi:transcription termination/antitermination protein NusG